MPGLPNSNIYSSSNLGEKLRGIQRVLKENGLPEKPGKQSVGGPKKTHFCQVPFNVGACIEGITRSLASLVNLTFTNAVRASQMHSTYGDFIHGCIVL